MKKVLFALAIASILMTSCDKQNALSQTHEDDQITFSISKASGLGFETTTRATEAITELASFNVRCLNSSSENVFDQVFSEDSGNAGTYKAATAQYWPLTDNGYKFYASNINFTSSPATALTVSAANTTDVVCAACESPTFKTQNALTFEHVFARIGDCALKAPEGYVIGDDYTITLTPNTAGTYNVSTKAWSNLTAGDATSIKGNTDLYVVPGTYTLTVTYTLTKGAWSDDFEKSGTVTFVAGYINSLGASDGTGQVVPGPTEAPTEITFSITLTAWDSRYADVAFN